MEATKPDAPAGPAGVQAQRPQDPRGSATIHHFSRRRPPSPGSSTPSTTRTLMPATDAGAVTTPTPLQNDPTMPLGVNIVGQSPHVFVYRVWSRVPGAAGWTVVNDGNTTDQVPDFFTAGPYQDGAQVSYWVAVAGKPDSVFRFSIIFTQDGRVPFGGTITHQDHTSGKGGAVVEGSVILV